MSRRGLMASHFTPEERFEAALEDLRKSECEERLAKAETKLEREKVNLLREQIDMLKKYITLLEGEVRSEEK